MVVFVNLTHASENGKIEKKKFDHKLVTNYLQTDANKTSKAIGACKYQHNICLPADSIKFYH